MGEGAAMMNRDIERDPRSLNGDALPQDDETAEIRANIEQTRADMSETIDAIQERLNPTHLKEQAKEQVREQFEEAKEMVREATIGRVEHMVQQASDTVNDARYTMVDTIRENPIPAALVGIGLGWLFMNRSSRTPVRYSGRGSVRGQGVSGNRGYYDDRQYAYNDRGYYDNRQYAYDDRQRSSGGMIGQSRQAASNVASNVSDTASNIASNVSDTASNIASNVSDTASNLAQRAQETASNLTDQAQYQAQRVEDRFQNTLQENPLAIGAIALALGTAVGLALPQTERENQLMGEARDTLIDRAQEVAQETVEKVQQVASNVTSDATQNVKEQAREHGLT
jgi:ElaB/YqjD/DUF883 family membrane-anchored ribosome-binding protein